MSGSSDQCFINVFPLFVVVQEIWLTLDSWRALRTMIVLCFIHIVHATRRIWSTTSHGNNIRRKIYIDVNDNDTIVTYHDKVEGRSIIILFSMKHFDNLLIDFKYAHNN